MKTRLLLSWLFLLGWVEAHIARLTSPQSDLPNAVVEHSMILVDGKPFLVKGVCYSPAPVGHNPVFAAPFGDYYTEDYSELWERDFPLLREMGANTIRVYGWGADADHNAFLDYAEQSGLKVLVTFYLGTATDYPVATPEDRQKIIDSFAAQVKQYAHHRAILAWSFGNEINGNWNLYLQAFSDANSCNWNPADYLTDKNGCLDYDSTEGACGAAVECVYKGLFGWVDSAAQAAHEAMGESKQLITSSFADVDKLLLRIKHFEHYLPHMDVWGAQIYRGENFGVGEDDFLATFSNISSKTMLITEFGVDGYNDPCGTNAETPCYNTIAKEYPGFGEDQQTQAEWDVHLVKLMMDAAPSKGGKTSGGFVMAWLDEMWKTAVNVKGCSGVPVGLPGFDPSRCDYKGHVLCPNKDISKPALCGYPLESPPDKYVNEGFFGMMTPHTRTGAVDAIRPKALYAKLQGVWGKPLPNTWVYLTIGVISFSALVFIAALTCALFTLRNTRSGPSIYPDETTPLIEF